MNERIRDTAITRREFVVAIGAGRLSLIVQSERQHGYTEGREYVFEDRYADGDATARSGGGAAACGR